MNQASHTRDYTQMQNPAPLKFLIQLNVSDPEIHICYDYYCPPTGQNNTLLEHIIWVCQKHHLNPKQLADTLKKFRAYDSTIACQKCHILKQVTEPNLITTFTTNHTNTSIKNSKYICPSCYDFITSE